MTAHSPCDTARAKLVAGSAVGVVMHGSRAAAPPARPGTTLVELLVAIVIVGLLAGVAGLAARRAPAPSAADLLVSAVTGARRIAVREHRSTTIELRIDGEPHAVTALPDGGVIAGTVVRERLGIDRLTGVTHAGEAQTHAR